MSFSLACVLCPSFVRLLFFSLSLLAQLSWAVFPGSLWRLPVLPLGSVLHAGASVLEARGGSVTANSAHGHVCALPFIRSATLLGRSVPRFAGVCSASWLSRACVFVSCAGCSGAQLPRRPALSGDRPPGVQSSLRSAFSCDLLFWRSGLLTLSRWWSALSSDRPL